MSDLRAIRKRLGLTQAELADRLGVSRATIVQRELGRVPVTRETELAMRALLTDRQDQSHAESVDETTRGGRSRPDHPETQREGTDK